MAHRLRSGNETDEDTPDADPIGTASRLRPLGRRSALRLGLAGIVSLLAGSGTVTAARTAASGTDDPAKGILIRPNEGVTRYEITVDGRLSPGADTERDAEARISGSSAEGVVKQGDRRYRFSGELRDVAIDGDAGVYIGTADLDPD
jgi:hypothetical protein